MTNNDLPHMGNFVENRFHMWQLNGTLVSAGFPITSDITLHAYWVTMFSHLTNVYQVTTTNKTSGYYKGQLCYNVFQAKKNGYFPTGYITRYMKTLDDVRHRNFWMKDHWGTRTNYNAIPWFAEDAHGPSRCTVKITRGANG